ARYVNASGHGKRGRRRGSGGKKKPAERSAGFWSLITRLCRVGADLRRRCLGDRAFGQEALRRAAGLLLLAGVVVRESRPRRNQPADDDVLLQATQLVLLAHDRGLGKHARRLLERSRRDERIGRQRRLGDAQQHVLVRRRLLGVGPAFDAAALGHAIVLVQEVRALDLLARYEASVARIQHLHPPQHLPYDHFDMLVVDLYALQPVDVLHLYGDVARQRLDAEQPQDVVRIRRAVDDRLALVDHLPVVRGDVLVLRYQILVRDPVQIGDHQPLLALGVLAERDRAGHLRQRSGILRRARLEQLGNARQAPGDIPRLRRFLRNPRQHFADGDVLAVLDGDDRAQLEGDVHRQVGPGELHFLPLLVQQLHLRTHALGGSAGAALRIDDDERRQTGDFVDLLRDGDAFLDVLELHAARVLGDDRTRGRVPRSEHLARLHLFAVLDQHRRAVRHLVALALAAVVVVDQHFARACDDDQLALAVGHIAHDRGEAHDTRRLAFQLRSRRGTRCRAADVERPHRQLRSRLADRLRGDDADRFADVDQVAAAQIAAVAGRAQPVTRVAGQGRAHLDLVDAQRLDLLDLVFGQQHPGVVQRFLRLGIDDVGGERASEDALAQRFDHLAAFDQRLHRY